MIFSKRTPKMKNLSLKKVEEEASVTNVIAQLKLVKDSGHGMFLLNKELATRQLMPPTA